MTAMTYLEDSDLNKAQKTFIGSLGAGIWRLTIIPVDSFKSHLQVHGSDGMSILRNKIKTNGISTLYNGSSAAFSGTVIGHFPWFYTYNYLQENMPYKKTDSSLVSFLRSGSIGFLSSATSDIVSNSVRVLKISKQTNENNHSYTRIIKDIVKKDNFSGLFFRGLQTKLLLNGIQGFVFVLVFDRLKEFLESIQIQIQILIRRNSGFYNIIDVCDTFFFRLTDLNSEPDLLFTLASFVLLLLTLISLTSLSLLLNY